MGQFLFSSQDVESWMFSTIHSAVQGEVSMASAISFFLSVARLYLSHQSSKTGKREASPLESILRIAGVLDAQITAFCFMNRSGTTIRGKLLITFVSLPAV